MWDVMEGVDLGSGRGLLCEAAFELVPVGDHRVGWGAGEWWGCLLPSIVHCA